MLHNLGVGHIIEPPLPQTTALIDRMTHYCANADPLCGLTALCLGAEAIVPMLYSAVYQAARGLGYTAAQLKYLQLHIECDDGHALTMYQIITRRTVSSPHMVKPVIAIAREMLEYRCNFLTALMLPESKALP